MSHLSIHRIWTQFVRLLAIALCATLLSLTATAVLSPSQAQTEGQSQQIEEEPNQDSSTKQKEEGRSPDNSTNQSEDCELSRQVIQSQNRNILFCVETGILNESGEQRVARIQQQIDKILQGIINVETLEIVALEELERSLGVSRFQDLASQSNEDGAVAIVSRSRSLTGTNQIILVITELDASLHLTQSDQANTPETEPSSITPHDLAEQYVNTIIDVSRQEYASQKCFPVIFNSSPYTSATLEQSGNVSLKDNDRRRSCLSTLTTTGHANEVTLFYVSTAGNFWNAPFRANVISNQIDEFTNALPFDKSLDDLEIRINFAQSANNNEENRIDSDSSPWNIFESADVNSICSDNFEATHNLTDIQSHIKNYICDSGSSPSITLQHISETSESSPSTDILMTLSLEDAKLYELSEIGQNNESNQTNNEESSEGSQSDKSPNEGDEQKRRFNELHLWIKVAQHHQAQITQAVQDYRNQYGSVLYFMFIPVVLAILIWISIISIVSIDDKNSTTFTFFKKNRDKILSVYSLFFSLYFNVVLLFFVVPKSIWLIVIPIAVFSITTTYLFVYRKSSRNLSFSNSSLIASLIAILSSIFYLFYFFPLIRRSFIGDAAQTISSLLSSYFENELPILVGILLIAFLLYLAIPPTLAWVASQLLGYTSHESHAAKVSRSRAIAKVTRLVIIILTFIMASPHLPGAGTAYFAGVSGFVALAFSVSASTSVGDLISGLIIVFFSKIEEGDRVNICNGISGTIIEQNLFVHRIRTGSNEIVTIRNAKILSDAAIDYTESESDPDNPLEISIPVTLSYDYDWREVDRLLKKAAIAAAAKIKSEPLSQTTIEQIDQFVDHVRHGSDHESEINEIDESIRKELSNLSEQLQPNVSHADLNPSFVVYELSICPRGMNIPDLRSQIIQEIRDKCAIASIDLIAPQYQANWPFPRPSVAPERQNNAAQ